MSSDIFTPHATILSPPELTRSGEHSCLHNHDHYSPSVPWPLEQLPVAASEKHGKDDKRVVVNLF